jgi:hypothetical protein
MYPFKKLVKKSILLKHLGTNLTKDVKDLCKENYKSLKKELKEDYRRWKDLPWILMDWQNECYVKMAILSKQSTCSMQFSSKFK